MLVLDSWMIVIFVLSGVVVSVKIVLDVLVILGVLGIYRIKEFVVGFGLF